MLSLEILEDRLAPSADPLVFAIVGDYGTASSILNVPNLLLGVPDTEGDVARLIHSWNPEFLLTTGDNNYLCGEQFDANLIIELELAIGVGELSAATAQTILSGLAEIPVVVTTSVKANLTSGSNTVTVTSTTGLAPGMVVDGAGIPSPTGPSDPFFTKITEVVDASTIRLSAAATSTHTGESLVLFPADVSLQMFDGLSHIDRNIGRYYSDFIFPYVTSSPTGQFGNGSPTGFNRMFPTPGNHDWADPLSDGGTSVTDMELCLASEAVQKFATLDGSDPSNMTLTIAPDVSRLEVGMSILGPGLPTVDPNNPISILSLAHVASIDAQNNRITLDTAANPALLIPGTTLIFLPILLPTNLDAYLDFFAGLNPINSPTLKLGTGLTEPFYYSFTQGTTSDGRPLIEFFAFDSEPADPNLANGNPPGSLTPEQVIASPEGQWLQTAMLNSQAVWKIPYFHHSPYSSANDPDEGPNGSWMQLPFQALGASAVVYGHVHNYERLSKSDPGGTVEIPYFLNGLGGAEISPFLGPVDPGSQIRYNGEVGAMRVVADEDHITFQFINSFGAIIDEYSIGPAYEFVRQVYRDVLDREADLAGLQSWVSQLQAGASREQVADGIWSSAEHRGLQVDGFYATYLNRAADPAGRASWVNALLAGVSVNEVEVGFLTSAEYTTAHPTDLAYVQGLYADVLGRAPDPVGEQAWTMALQHGATQSAVAGAFLTSTEALLDLVDTYYATFLDRPADPAGQQAWLSALQSGQLSEDQVAIAFLASDEFFALAQM